MFVCFVWLSAAVLSVTMPHFVAFLVLNKDSPFCGLNVKYLMVFFETPRLLRNSVSALEFFFFLLMAECFHFCFFLANEISNKFEQV